MRLKIMNLGLAVVVAVFALAVSVHGDYATEVMADSPVLYLRFGETNGSTTAADSSGNSNHGTYNGGVTLGVSGGLETGTDTAVDFDGTSGYVEVPNAANLQITNDVTIEVWLKPDVNNVLEICMEKGANGDSNLSYGFAWNTDGKLRFLQENGLVEASGYVMQTGTWQHVAMVRDATAKTIEYFVNGVSQGSAGYAGKDPVDNTAPLRIASAGDGQYNYNGQLDELAIYDGKLSSGRIFAHYHAGLDLDLDPYAIEVIADSPVLYLRFGETNGSTTAADSSGNSNHGTYNGGVTLGVPNGLETGTDTAVDFDGTSGYVEVPNAANLQITNDVTIEVWLKPDVNNALQICMEKGANGDSNLSYGFAWHTDGKLRFLQYIGLVEASGYVMQTGTWQHVAMVRDATAETIEYFVNGVSQGSAGYNGTYPVDNTAPLRIASAGDGQYNYNGQLDELAIYDGKLSSGRIQAHFASSIVKGTVIIIK